MSHGHKFPHDRAPILEDPARALHLNADRVLDLAGIQTGMAVLDVGCGTGYIVRPAASRVGPGGSRRRQDRIITPPGSRPPMHAIEFCRASDRLMT